MAVSLPYLGEELIAGMANQMRLGFLEVCDLVQACDRNFVLSTDVPIAYTEVKLQPYAGKRFDGASRVDVVVLLTPSLGVPFEVKLGTTRLSKSRIDEEWLSGCGLSHQETRYTGNMMSILEHKFQDHVGAEPLHVQIGGLAVELTSYWFVIARNGFWLPGKAAVAHHSVLTLGYVLSKRSLRNLEGLVHSTAWWGGMLNFDYHSEWVLGDYDEDLDG